MEASSTPQGPDVATGVGPTSSTPADVPPETKDEETKAQGYKDYYCPGCGKQFDYQRECIGTPTAPHPPIEVVSTDELSGDSANHTAAPGEGEIHQSR